MRIAEPSTILVYLPLYIAAENKEHEVINYDGPKKSIEAAAKGDVDLSIGDPFMFNYINYEEKNIVICAAFIRKIVHSLISFNPFIEESSKKYLKGKILVSYPEPSTSFFVSREIKEKYSLANTIKTPFNTELGPLLTQEADLAIVLEPNATYALKNGARELEDFTHIKDTTTGFCTNKSFYRNNKKQISDFLKDLKQGIQIFQNDEEKTLEIAKKYFPLTDESILKESIERIRKADVYCKNFKFTDSEITAGLKLRRIELSPSKIKKIIVT